MKPAQCPPVARFLIVPVMGLTALILFANTTYGQGVSVPIRDTSATERTIGALESESRRAKRDPQAIMAEINDDFSRLRVINEDLKAVVAAAASLNYKAISDQGVEIKKRGQRLRSNLAALPKGEKEEKIKEGAPGDEAEMKALLTSMNTVLTSFLSNPIFSDMGSLDNKLALKARRDLDYAINLSEVVKNGAEKLSKRH